MFTFTFAKCLIYLFKLYNNFAIVIAGLTVTEISLMVIDCCIIDSAEIMTDVHLSRGSGLLNTRIPGVPPGGSPTMGKDFNIIYDDLLSGKIFSFVKCCDGLCSVLTSLFHINGFVYDVRTIIIKLGLVRQAVFNTKS